MVEETEEMKFLSSDENYLIAWANKHLNVVFYLVLLVEIFVLILGYITRFEILLSLGLVGVLFYLFTTGWYLIRKKRSLWWILLAFGFVSIFFGLLENKNKRS
jgi:hypothetical protein